MTETVVRLTATTEDGTVVYVLANAKGELKLEEPIAPPEFDGQLDGNLSVTGSAEFASDITLREVGNVSTNVIEMRSDSNNYESIIEARNSNGGSNLVLRTGMPGNPADRLRINRFGDVLIGGDDVANTPNTTLSNDGSAVFAGGAARVWSNGSFGVKNTNGGSTSAITVYDPDNADKKTITLRNTGHIDIGGSHVSSLGSSNPNIRLRPNGMATFANGKAGFTEEGNLFCTTMRGDLVVLENTSGGFGAWVEYTPQRDSLIDEILDRAEKDKLRPSDQDPFENGQIRE